MKRTDAEKVLFVEDNEVDIMAFKRWLDDNSPDFDADIVKSLDQAREYLEDGDYDVVISDHFLEEGTSFDLMKKYDTLPFIIVTRAGDEEIAVKAMKKGAYDYIVKDSELNYFDVLPVTVDKAVEKRNFQKTLKKQARIINQVQEAIICIDMTGQITSWNEGAVRLFGYTTDEIFDINIKSLMLNDSDKSIFSEDSLKELTEEEYRKHRVWLEDKNRERFYGKISLSLLPEKDADEIIVYILDDTDRKIAQEKLEKNLKNVKDSRSDLRSILNRLDVITAITDKDGFVNYLSQTGREILQINKEETPGKKITELIPLKKKHKQKLEQLKEQPEEKRERLSLETKNHKTGTLKLEIKLLDDPRENDKHIYVIYDKSELHNLKQQLKGKARYQDIIGKSKPMKRLYTRIKEVADVEWTVLIEGETGSGKELVARAIHNAGPRKDKPFIALNCAGLNDSLLSSRLFGHRKGAFTGAVDDQEGVFEAANGGTLLLDEIGDVSESLQTSLLRVLEERKITRLGESEPVDVDVRILAATHRDLAEESREGNFRSDLLYRLRVARINIPPLRERREDIPLLANYFLEKSLKAADKDIEGISDDAMQKLLKHRWPGNVRELKSAIEFALIHCKNDHIAPSDFPEEIVYPPESEITEKLTLETDDEKKRILTALERTGGNRTEAARLLDIGRSTLYRKIDQYDISTNETGD